MTGGPGAATADWAAWAEHTLRGEPAPPPVGEPPVDALILQGLAALVQAALRATRDPRSARFGEIERTVVGQNLLRRAQVQPYLDALDRAGVRYVAIKGEAAVRRDPTLAVTRPMSDVDILVDPAHFRRAITIGLGLGYQEPQTREPLSQWWNCERGLYQADVAPALVIDLHHALHRRPLFGRLGHDTLRTAERVDGAWIPGVRESICVAAAHRSKHGFFADARELLDVRRLLDTLDADGFDRLLADARRWEVDGGLWLVWDRARSWFGSTGPAEDAALARLHASLGVVRGRGMEWLAGLDGLDHAARPWSALPFLQMYVPMPLVTGRVVAPVRLAATHAVLRFADTLVAGPDAVGHLPAPLRPLVEAVSGVVGRFRRR